MKTSTILFLIVAIVGGMYLYQNPQVLSNMNASIQQTDLNDLIENPQNYVEKNVTIIGTPTANWLSPYKFSSTLVIKDKEGKPIYIDINYTFYCEKCKIEGKVKFLDLNCSCQSAICEYGEYCLDEVYYNKTNERGYPLFRWSNILTPTGAKSTVMDGLIESSYCPKEPKKSGRDTYVIYRCDPNTISQKYYYLDVIDVTSLDKN